MIYKAAKDYDMKIGWAGTSCIDHCRPGKRRGEHGPTSVVFQTWAAERRQRQEVLYFQENTEDFKPDILRRVLGDIYEINSMFLGPENCGWWANRPRHFCILVLKSAGTLAQTDLGAFMRYMCNARPQDCLQGQMFWCAPDDVIQDAMHAEAARLQVAEGTYDSWWDLLAEGDRNRLAEYDRAVAEFENSLEVGQPFVVRRKGRRVIPKTIASAGMISNPKQSIGAPMGHLTAYVPTLLRRSLIWGHQQNRPLIGREHLVVMGVPAFAREFGGDFEPPWIDTMMDMDDVTLKAFAGNAVHAMLAAAITQWTICCFVPHRLVALHKMPSSHFSCGFSSDFTLGGTPGRERKSDDDGRRHRRLRRKSNPGKLFI